jgi:RNA methyltransferase, TrmH family
MRAAMWRRPLRSQLTLWQSLDKAEVRRNKRLFLAEGYKVVSELLKSPWKIHALLLMEEKRARWDAFLTTLPDAAEGYILAASQWNKLSQDKNPEGIMAVVEQNRPNDISLLPDTGHILLSYRINNPNNLGALIRTAHWFEFAALLISGDSADFTNPKVVRTSMGSLFHIPIIADVDLAETLPILKKRYLLVAGSMKGGVAPHPCSRKIALLMGSESHGLPDSLMDLADEKWRIPGAGGADSLSLPQAAAIMMYEAARKID